MFEGGTIPFAGYGLVANSDGGRAGADAAQRARGGV